MSDKTDLCSNCGEWAQGNYFTHKNMSSKGPKQPLCDDCGVNLFPLKRVYKEQS